MILKLDTNDLKNINITFTDKEYELELPDLVDEFCFGMAFFYLDFALKFKCNTERAKKMKDVCLGITKAHIDLLLNKGMMEENKRKELDEELDELAERMADHGFSEKEINNAVNLARKLGGTEAAAGYLIKKLEEELGLDDEEDEE